MSLRGKVGLTVFGRKRALNKKAKVIAITAGSTGNANGAALGVIYADVATAGANTGDAYIAVDTSGSGTQIDV